MRFEIIGEITKVEVIARGRGIRELARLRKRYGGRTWRKLKGVALVRLASGRSRTVELHWYESHGVGKKETRIKRYLD